MFGTAAKHNKSHTVGSPFYSRYIQVVHNMHCLLSFFDCKVIMVVIITHVILGPVHIHV